MTDFVVKLQPDLVNMATEGSMDTSVVNGESNQRTLHGTMIMNGTDRKMVGRLKDGSQFNDSVQHFGTYSDVSKVTSLINILANDIYVDWVQTPTGSGHEANNLMAVMDQAGISYDHFTEVDAATFSSFPANGTVIIPELEKGNLYPDLTNDAKFALATFVYNGGKLIMFAPDSGDPLDVINGVFSFNLSWHSYSNPISLTIGGASLFPTESLTIPNYSATDAIDGASLPVGSVVIYAGNGGNDEALVTKMPYGSGEIYMLGWDWFGAAPLGNNDSGWNHLFKSILAS